MVRAKIRLLVFMWTHAEMFNSLSRILLSPQQKGIMSLGSSQSQLIQSDDFTTTLLNSRTCCLGDFQSSNAQLWNFQHSHIIGNRADDYDRLSFILFRVRHLTVDEADRDGRTVNTGLKKTFEDDLVEFRVGAAGKETVQLYEEEQVDVLGRRGFAMALSDVVAFDKVDTLKVSILFDNSTRRARDSTIVGCRDGG